MAEIARSSSGTCAALFKSIVQIKPGVFELRSSYKENFIGSLHLWVYLSLNFSPEETVAYALVRHAERYFRIRDALAGEKLGTRQIKPRALGPPNVWKNGVVRPTGEFTRDLEADGELAVLFWQDKAGDPRPSLALEICGPGVAQHPTVQTPRCRQSQAGTALRGRSNPAPPAPNPRP
jgi:hypothetical protein